MNDSELDRLLNTWETPAPSSALRDGVREHFPRAERRGFRFRLRWVLAVAVVSATLMIAMGQPGSDGAPGGLTSFFRMGRVTFMQWAGPWQAHRIFTAIMESHPQVYVDGALQTAPQLHPWHAATMWVEVPGDGTYLFSTYRALDGPLVRAGGIHGNVVEFQAGTHTVRIECSAPIVNIDRVIFAVRRP